MNNNHLIDEQEFWDKVTTTPSQKDTHEDGSKTAVNQNIIGTEREFHNEETSTYWLPKDDEEQKRLTGQHFAFKELYEGNVLPSIRKTLDFQKGISILDVGCSSGVWIMDMMTEYPNCTYHGCDIVNVIDKKLSLKQFTFNYGNVTKRLPYEDNTFDFVHMRFFVLALNEEHEWPAAISEVIRVTKPGGMMQIADCDFQLPKDPSFVSYKVTKAIHTACISRGQNPNIGAELEKMISKHDNVKIVQADYRTCDMSSGTSTAKKFIWDHLEGLKSIQPIVGPILGIKTKEDLANYLTEYKHSLETEPCLFSLNSVAAQKL
ncbi:S-adenosyl-L-methionine-dependent methyltransferase [Rhizopus microsporus var. microsporus]|uniref:S-adenosyl-L-methionine-dependent methyltransferase n=2 Tax=Rhizopus microsporus TaxID=58291 RepID=A0A2G4STP4_RHIZD|nr:S-adenosyl-L-methionine-dependent methyltransferase [Rhizopus microsporus ATCC 52813]ORE11545.1 S-adenosyl-L-methionine-dependent methyltransferase [Rhizopus microsporus var. microsporus]PHZ12157.1 S-adenosyl-L-methionine-dependent methyltransferase [Rhizopus microsporus ATCC 52813]